MSADSLRLRLGWPAIKRKVCIEVHIVQIVEAQILPGIGVDHRNQADALAAANFGCRRRHQPSSQFQQSQARAAFLSMFLANHQDALFILVADILIRDGQQPDRLPQH